MLLGSHVAGSTGRIGVTRLVGWSYGGLFYFPVLSLVTRWVESGTEYVGQWGRRLPDSFRLGSPSSSLFFPLICLTCVACVFQPQGPPCAPAPLSLFPISLCWHWLVILFWAPPFLREKIKEELIHIIHIHNPIIGCMIHQLTLQEGHTLLAHYPLRFFCHGVTMSLHISFWRCSFLFSSSMQVSWLTFSSSALHPGGPLNFSFLGQRLSVECHHENALLGNLLWSELLQKGLLRHHSHLLLPESDEVDWA